MQATATEVLQGLSVGWVWLSLLHSLWIGLAASSVVALIFQVSTTLSHRLRHTILLVALGLVAVGPTLLVLIPPLIAWRSSTGALIRTSEAVIASPGPTAVPSPQVASHVESGHLQEKGARSWFIRTLGVTLDRMTLAARRVKPIALTVWSVSVVALAALLALGACRLNRLCREAGPASQGVVKRARRLGRLLRLGTIPETRVHATLGEPCLGHVFRPVILLPGRWLASASPESIDAVLAHELAHARRYDHLLNLAQRVMEVVLFFNPGVHWLSRSLRRQSELCADALAVRLTGDPLALARALESVARLRLASPRPFGLGVTLGGEPSFLLPRIQELIGMTPIRTRRQVWPFVALPSAMIVALVATSVGLAQGEPSLSPARTQTAVDRPLVAGSGRVVPAAAPANSKVDSDKQISYEVRFITSESDAWRDHLEGLGEAVEQKSGISAWVIDRPALMSLLKFVREERGTNLLQAPKVTVFEHDPAMISWREKRQSRDGRGVAQKIAEGTEVKVLGSGLNRGTRITVDLSDSWLVPGQKEVASHPEADSEHEARISTATRHAELLEVPEDCSLIFNLGRRVRTLESKSMMCDRLIVITPRQIVLEPEGPPVKTTDRPAPPIKEKRRPGGTSVDVPIEGNVPLSTDKGRAKILGRVGTQLEPGRVDGDIQPLPATSFSVNSPYSDEDPNRRGHFLTFAVQEDPVLTHVEFRGMTHLKLEDVEQATGLKKGNRADVARTRLAVGQIQRLYVEKGYDEAKVTLLEGGERGDTRVVMQIFEGEKFRVSAIDFVGNVFSSDATLRTKITSRTAIPGLIGGKYNRDNLDEDVRRLTEYYRDQGFMLVKVSPVTRPGSSLGDLQITYVITEGPRLSLSLDQKD